MNKQIYPTRRFEARGFDASEAFRNGGGKWPFEYLERKGDLLDLVLQRRLPTYGAAACFCNLPVPYRMCNTKWNIIIRSTPCRVNGLTADSGTLVLVPPHVEFEVQQQVGWEYGLDTESEHLEALIRTPANPAGVVAVGIDRRIHGRLQEMICRELEGDEVEGGILAQALMLFDTGSENLITPAREMMARRVREAIDEHLDGDVCLSDICLDLGVSIRTAERAFRVRFQETMSGYIRRARLEWARQLLTSGIPVTEAALAVGWTHLGRFSGEFKKRFGETPSFFRKHHCA